MDFFYHLLTKPVIELKVWEDILLDLILILALIGSAFILDLVIDRCAK